MIGRLTGQGTINRRLLPLQPSVRPFPARHRPSYPHRFRHRSLNPSGGSLLLVRAGTIQPQNLSLSQRLVMPAIRTSKTHVLAPLRTVLGSTWLILTFYQCLATPRIRALKTHPLPPLRIADASNKLNLNLYQCLAMTGIRTSKTHFLPIPWTGADPQQRKLNFYQCLSTPVRRTAEYSLFINVLELSKNITLPSPSGSVG